METKKKMNNRKFTILGSTAVAILSILAVAATVLMNFFSLSMEIFLGRGEMVTTVNPAMENADTKFYDDVPDELDAQSDAVALSIAEEGIVLMKNNGVLPLAKGASVTPFGYRYISPVYGGTGSGSVNTDSARISTASGALAQFFTVNAEMETAMNSAKARGMSATAYESPDEQGGFEGAVAKIIEYDLAVYSGHEASVQARPALCLLAVQAARAAMSAPMCRATPLS